jgi:hypothetical protein
LYGLVYMNTVATFPRAIFIVSIAIASISFTLLAFVRLPNERRDLARSREGDDDVEEGAEIEVARDGLEREETLVDISLGQGEGTVFPKSPAERSS